MPSGNAPTPIGLTPVAPTSASVSTTASRGRLSIWPVFATLTMARNGRPFTIAAMMSADSSGECSSGIGSSLASIALTWAWEVLSMS